MSLLFADWLKQNEAYGDQQPGVIRRSLRAFRTGEWDQDSPELVNTKFDATTKSIADNMGQLAQGLSDKTMKSDAVRVGDFLQRQVTQTKEKFLNRLNYIRGTQNPSASQENPGKRWQPSVSDPQPGQNILIRRTKGQAETWLVKNYQNGFVTVTDPSKTWIKKIPLNNELKTMNADRLPQQPAMQQSPGSWA
jgi:hypothetical protein